MNLSGLFEVLRNNQSNHAFTASAVSDLYGVYIGINLVGQPCLFVETNNAANSSPLKTAKLSYRPSQVVNISIDQQFKTGIFHMLICESTDKVEIASFITVLEAFLANHIGQVIDGNELSIFFKSMVRLFAISPTRDINNERQGLWGELFMMKNEKGFRFWVPFWHCENNRVFDFSSEGKHVEVKTTTYAQRIHHFSHRQIYAGQGEEIMIASMLLFEDDAGLSLRSLLNECREAIRGTPDYFKLERALRKAGMEDEEVTGPKYNSANAEQTLAWYTSTSAPHFRLPEPAGVSETRYKVDLSTAPRMTNGELDAWLISWAG